MKKVLLFALALYLLIAPLTYHPDNKLVLKWASLGEGKVWNIYSFQDANPSIDAKFNYPPIHFYLAKLQYTTGALIGGSDFTSWLSTSSESDAFEQNLPQYSLAIKFVLLLATLGVGHLIYLLVVTTTNNTRTSILAACLWLFNPVVLYSVVMMGQNDVLAILFFLLGWYVFKGKWWYFAPLLFALSIGVKFYPVLWLFFLLASSLDRQVKTRVLVGATSLLLTLLIVLPFAGSTAFRTNVLQSSINDRFLVPQISLGYEEVVYLIPALLVLTFSLALSFALNRDKVSVLRKESVAILVANSLLLGFSHFHPQWFTWLIPFWAISLVLLPSTERIRIFWLSCSGLISWIMIILLFKDAYLSFGIITPLRGDLLFIPRIFDGLTQFGVDVTRMTSTFHSILAGLALASFSLLFVSNKTEMQALGQKKYRLIVRSKILAFIIAFGVPLLAIFLGIFLVQLAPVPVIAQSSNTPQFETIQPMISDEIKSPDYGAIKRIDLAFRNPGILSTQSLLFEVLDVDLKVIQSVPFSGRNIGDTSMVRFDLHPVFDPATRHYVRITSTAFEDAPVQLGLVSGNERHLWTTAYIVPTNRFQTAVLMSVERFVHIIASLWWLYLLIGFMLLYIFIERPSVKRN